MELDIKFIEFYIKMKYEIKLHEYFGVSEQASSRYRKKGIPDTKKYFFVSREGTINVKELYDNLVFKQFDFIEFYILKTYNIKSNKYFGVSNTQIMEYRKKGMPEYQVKRFIEKEGSIDPDKLFEKIY